MSPTIWTRCGGRSNDRTIEGPVWRVVESQQRISTRRLVDSDAEHGLLEDLIETSKPPIPKGPEFEGLDFLLFSPFRYPPLGRGSRFGSRHERALWYGSEQIETALAEVAYYRLLYLGGSTANLLPNRVAKSAFQAVVRSRATIDLTRAPFDAHRATLCSKTDYTETRRLGTEMREAGVEMIRFTSTRDPKEGANIALFTPAAFALRNPLGPAQTWHCTVTASRDVSWMREDVTGLTKLEFPYGTFLVGGTFPAPALSG